MGEPRDARLDDVQGGYADETDEISLADTDGGGGNVANVSPQYPPYEDESAVGLDDVSGGPTRGDGTTGAP